MHQHIVWTAEVALTAGAANHLSPHVLCRFNWKYLGVLEEMCPGVFAGIAVARLD